MHRTPTLATVAEATPATTGCPSCTVTQAAGRHAMVVAHFFESGQRRRLRWGRVESAPLMAGAVAAGQHRVHSCDRRKGLGGATSARPGRPGFPQREPALPTETAREQSTRAQGRVILLERGWIAAQLRPPGTGCSPANGTPEELRRLARPCVLSIALPLRFYYDFTETSAKISGVAYASNVIRTY